MFTRAIAFTFTLALSVLAAATPADPGNPPRRPQCSTGKLQCCKQMQNATDPAMTTMLSVLGIVVQGVDALVGLDCNPITIIGVATGNECNAQAICCPVNSTGGLVSVGCIPVTL
ncbi:fungal hydrophobin [Cerioporus squamosus]|nr:fungal hydrophobin [Cerioporus squamosus]